MQQAKTTYPEEVERLGLILEIKYGICKASRDLRRMTAELEVVDTKRSEHFITHKYCLIQYIFKENDHSTWKCQKHK